MSDLAIVARGLTRRFGTLVAVDHVDLDIARGEIFGFLGPNGSGKSTTIRMLCGLLTPSAGEAIVLGHELPRDAEVLKRNLGYMTQRFSLYDDLTCTENLQFIAEIFCLPRAQRMPRVRELLQAFQLEPLGRQRAGTLSGGQRQRLALAAAVLHRPQLLLLDEPTSAVDPQSRRDFWEKLFDLAAAGTTVLVSTHYMDEAERCHGLAILDRGAVVARGTPAQLERDIGASVVIVETEDARSARATLAALPDVFSVTQLGTILRVLVQSTVTQPDQLVSVALAGAGLRAQARRATPSLEDVFVAATQGRLRPEEGT